ncbi:hypothetical protein EIP91_010038 [Steccherinum ochraceum]|uniref:Uncharacterized protein n=1 Tax=Steccherinum ochraceum TaxID=92696 RepID=A0A4R0R0Z4_9APHY|nr:hypothetical protein EIP91_010038 [Steccherinum ochraceum]
MSSGTNYTALPVVQVDLSGRTVLVVGSNVGLGYEAVKHVARMNPKRLIATCRSEEKCRKTEEEIKKETGYQTVECWPLELTSFASVKAFADRLEREGGGRLNLVLLNAAIATYDYALTEDGYEAALQTNHLSGALLSYLLLPALLKSAEASGRPSRLAIVASDVHEWVDFRADRFSQDKGIVARLSSAEYSTENMRHRYPETKLLNVLFARALQSHLPPIAPVIVTSVNPGFCISELRRSVDHGQFDELLKTARTTEEGRLQLVIGLIGPRDGREDEMRGGYVSDNEVRKPSAWVESAEGKEAQERIWKETLEILAKVDTRVDKVAELFTA